VGLLPISENALGAFQKLSRLNIGIAFRMNSTVLITAVTQAVTLYPQITGI